MREPHAKCMRVDRSMKRSLRSAASSKVHFLAKVGLALALFSN
jgi:hypothetical protein